MFLQRAANRGFTLIELMITIVVLAVLLALAVPSFARLIASNRISTQTNEFTAALHLARIEAVRRGQPVAIRSDSAGSDFQSGWKVFTDGNADGAAASPFTTADGTVIRESGVLGGSTSVTRVTRSGTAPSFTYTTASSSDAARMYLVFNSRGANSAGSAAFFKICDSRNPTLPGRIVQISTVGKISLDSTTESCS